MKKVVLLLAALIARLDVWLRAQGRARAVRARRGRAGGGRHRHSLYPEPTPQETDAYLRLDQTLDATATQSDALFYNPPEGVPSSPRIVIYKDMRWLELYDGEKLIGRFRIALGFAPVGDKEKEGDGKTPEGDYYVCMRNESSRFHLSLGVSYPSCQRRAKGRRRGADRQRGL